MSQFIVSNNDITQKDLQDLLNLMSVLSKKRMSELRNVLKDISYWQRVMKYTEIATVRDTKLNNKLIGIGMLVEHIQGFGYYSIEDVVRNSNYNSCGIGSLIMKELHNIARSKGVKEVVLTSNEKRVAAHTLYKKLGYELTSTTCKFKIYP